MAKQCHIQSPLRSAVSRTLLTAFACLTPVRTDFSAAHAETVAGAGFSGAETLRPYNSLSIAFDGTYLGWDYSLDGNGRAQLQDGLRDATFDGAFRAETLLLKATRLELDAAYGFERERTASLKQQHSIRADVGLQHRFEGITLKADAGFATFLHQDTRQSGFHPIDRTDEDFTESEVALRTTFSAFTSLQPFLETAYVRRDYFKNPAREFDGPEFVAGVTLDGQRISGDFGAIYATRKNVTGEQSQMLGPYVDLKWKPLESTEVSLAMSAGIDQDTTGLADLYPYYSLKLELSEAVTETVKLTAIIDSVVEDRLTGREVEINPTIQLAWSGDNGFGLHATAGLIHVRAKGDLPTTDPSFEIGMSWTWGNAEQK